ncbi:hypothetical protein pb186bvf_016078 [Paramecium bursaria]
MGCGLQRKTFQHKQVSSDEIQYVGTIQQDVFIRKENKSISNYSMYEQAFRFEILQTLNKTEFQQQQKNHQVLPRSEQTSPVKGILKKSAYRSTLFGNNQLRRIEIQRIIQKQIKNLVLSFYEKLNLQQKKYSFNKKALFKGLQINLILITSQLCYNCAKQKCFMSHHNSFDERVQSSQN